MDTEGKKQFTKLGIRIGIAFLTAFGILFFVAYFVLSQNFQNLLTDYTLRLMQSMVKQGVTTVEHELQDSQEEAAALANSLSIPAGEDRPAILPTASSRQDILRIIYVPKNDSLVSDGRQDITDAFHGKNAVHGPYFNEDKKYIICYTVPVRRNGEVVGALSIEKDGYYFGALIKDIRFVDTGESYIVNTEGTTIAVSKQNHIAWVNEQYNAARILSEREDPVARSVLELEQKGLAGETGVGSYTWNGGLCYFAYAPIPSVRWALMAGLREEELTAMTQAALYASMIKEPALAACIAIFLLLIAAIVFWIVSSLKKSAEMNERLKIIANYDPLTGAMNRNSYHNALHALAAKQHCPLACVYIDVNGLHEINNHLGHQAGDEMLKTVSGALQRFFPKSDIFRIGGDEFVILCKNQDKRDVDRKTALAREELKKQSYEISIGIAWRDQDVNVLAMVNAAEDAMQRDKRRFYQENGKERQMRALDQKLEHMLLEKQDADTFLSVLAPEFKGVYFVNLGRDTIRHLYIPSYFEKILEETGDVFSKAMSLYVDRVVEPAYRRQFEKFYDYECLETLLGGANAPEYIYQKLDGTWLKLRILKFKTYAPQNRETLWIFSKTDRQA